MFCWFYLYGFRISVQELNLKGCYLNNSTLPEFSTGKISLPSVQHLCVDWSWCAVSAQK